VNRSDDPVTVRGGPLNALTLLEGGGDVVPGSLRTRVRERRRQSKRHACCVGVEQQLRELRDV
jgi:hypothetical protein